MSAIDQALFSLSDGAVISTTASESMNVKDAATLSIHAHWLVSSFLPLEFTSDAIDPGTSAIFVLDHGATDGLKGQLTTDDTLPGGLFTDTDYYIIVIDSANFYLSETNGGPIISFSDVGSGNHVFTPTSLEGASVKIQVTNDPSTLGWVDVPDSEMLTGVNSQDVIASDSHMWIMPKAAGHFYRVLLTIGSGSVLIGAMGYAK